MRERRSGWWLAGGILLVLAFAFYVYGEFVEGNDSAIGLMVAPVLLLLATPLIRREARLTKDFDAAGLLFCAVAAKMVAAYLRLAMVENIYSGNGDSTRYHLVGGEIAKSYRQFDFSIETEGDVPGTGFIEIVTGAVYTITGTHKFAGFLVFSFMAFLGCYLLYRAFVTAVPNGDHYRYAVLVFLWPTVIFWPSSVGKEGWMLLAIGLAAWGAARLYLRLFGGVLAVALGVLMAYAVRPHIAILLLAALAVGFVMSWLFQSEHQVKSTGFWSKTLAALALVLMGAYLAPRVATFLDVEDVGGSGFTQALEILETRTTDGSSTFGSASVENPWDYPWALVTVLFRPFPWEANNLQSTVAALEGLLLLGLLITSIRRLLRLPIEFIRRPYAAFAAAYVFMFCYVFASVANFGILTRQRSQLLPFVFVLIALPLTEKMRQRRDRYKEMREEHDEAEAAETMGRRPLRVVTTGLGPPR